jgi:hypothetical protein
MKSAYELAMERLAASDPEASAPLTDAQKSELAEIERRHRARRAEREVFLGARLAEAEAAGKFEDVEQIRRQLVSERAVIEEECEAEKDRVRSRSKR